MPTDVERFQTIRSQTLTLIETLTANPKPSYNIDGQQVLWADYLRTLQETIAWADDMIAGDNTAWEVETHLKP